MSFNQFQSVNKYSFDGLTNLIDLRINNNLIEKVEDDSMLTVNNLQTIDLSFNRITSISKRTFNGLSRVIDINLNYNHITEIDTEAFADLPNLINLSVDNNPVQISNKIHDCTSN